LRVIPQGGYRLSAPPLPMGAVSDDRSAFCTSDRVGIRAVLRVGFAFPREVAIVKINAGGS